MFALAQGHKGHGDVRSVSGSRGYRGPMRTSNSMQRLRQIADAVPRLAPLFGDGRFSNDFAIVRIQASWMDRERDDYGHISRTGDMVQRYVLTPALLYKGLVLTGSEPLRQGLEDAIWRTDGPAEVYSVEAPPEVRGIATEADLFECSEPERVVQLQQELGETARNRLAIAITDVDPFVIWLAGREVGIDLEDASRSGVELE